MTIQPDAIIKHRFAEIRQTYTERDAILYALGVGLGADPLDKNELAYLIETDLHVLPSFGVTLASPGMWIRDPQFGVNFAKLVHSAQSTEFHNDLPPTSSVRATPHVVALHDRGPDKGAVLQIERTIRDCDTDLAYCTTRQTLLLRGDGGFGGEPPEDKAMPNVPDRPSDSNYEFQTSTRAALIYRLSGDRNPLHADPDFACNAGFPRPILHGLASYAIAAHVLSMATGAKLASLSCRFTGVVIPGDTLMFSVWVDGGRAWFVSQVGSRKVLDRGYATLTSGKL